MFRKAANRLGPWLQGVVLWLLLAWGATPSSAQNPVEQRRDSLLAVATRAGQSDSVNNQVKAVELWMMLLSEGNLEPRQRALVLKDLGSTYLQLGIRDSAMVYLPQALTASRNVQDRWLEAVVLSHIGGIWYNAGVPDSAVTYLRSALTIIRDIGPRSDEGVLLSNIGILYQASGRPDSAGHYLREALEVSREEQNQDNVNVVLIALGGLYLNEGRFDSAQSYYETALAHARGRANRGAEFLALSSIADLHIRFGRVDSALAYYRQALAVGDETGRGSAAAEASFNLAETFFRDERPDSAVTYARRALNYAEREGDRRLRGRAYAQAARALYRSRSRESPSQQLDSARMYLERAVDDLQAAQDLNGLASAHQSFAVIEFGREDIPAALAHAAESLTLARQVNDRTIQSRVMRTFGNIYTATSSYTNVKAASAYFDSAAVILGGIRATASRDQDRVDLAEEDQELFDEWLLTVLRDSSSAEPPALAALAVAERGRAQALIHLLMGGSPHAAGADLVGEGAELIARVQQRGESVLYFAVAADTLISWFIQPTGQVALRRVAFPQDSLETLVREARLLLSRDAGCSDDLLFQPRPAELFERLSSLLLPSNLAQLLPNRSELLIVPEGVLGLVPFAALSVKGSPEPLGIAYALRYSPSLTLSVAQRLPAEVRTSSRALVFGDPRMPEVNVCGVRFTPSPLAHARASAIRTASRLGVEPWLGDSATETRVKQHAAEADIIHIETHGFAPEGRWDAREAFLALAPSPAAPPASQEDGRLTVGEIVEDLPTLRAALVVLSACRTGIGEARAAEGTLGFQRAFLAKGARSVLVSLWSVPDESTGLLMDAFYRNWLDPEVPSKAEALRRAQHEVRQKHPDPRYWAAFQLVGQ